MKFELVTSTKDPYYKEALELYDSRLDIQLLEDKRIFKRSLENNKTENDYTFIVGVNEDNEVISMATAHYEATTNSAFLIYLLAKDGPDHDTVLVETLNQIEVQLNRLAQKVHGRGFNFLMLEVPKEESNGNSEYEAILRHRRQFLYENQFEYQHDIQYIHPNSSKEDSPREVDLFIKTYIELTKDIVPASIKSNYILKYVFANGLSRDIIYPLLEKMNLRNPQ